MTRTARGGGNGRAGDELLNEQFNTLLREAAEKREERSLVQATGDAVAAKQESADLLALARGEAPGVSRESEPPADGS
jgi:hypothetical protein